MVAVATAYLDASALVKLVVPEREMFALRAFLADVGDVVTCRISVVEVARAVARRDDLEVAGLDVLLRSLSYRELDPTLGALAAGLRPATLRTLDAIHLAAALSLGTRLDAFVTYDSRLAEAARMHALPVVSPGT